MNKIERQIAIIREKIPYCVKTTSAEVFCYGEIPLKCIQGAKASYAYGINNDDILALIDTTVFRGGQRGMVFTTDGVYFKDMLSSPIYCTYTDLTEFSIPDDNYFNSKGLKDMLQDLFDLEYSIQKGNSISNMLVDVIGNTAIEMLESWVDKKRIEWDEADKEETNALFEALYDIKNTLTLLIDTLKEVINIEVNLYDEEEVSQYFFCLTMCAASFGSQYFSEDDWIELGLEEITGQDFYTAQEESFEFFEFIDSAFDEFEEDEIEFERISLKTASRLFSHKIDTILEELQEDDIDVEELYQSSINEAKTLRNQLKKVRRNINKIIEYAYQEEHILNQITKKMYKIPLFLENGTVNIEFLEKVCPKLKNLDIKQLKWEIKPKREIPEYQKLNIEFNDENGIFSFIQTKEDYIKFLAEYFLNEIDAIYSANCNGAT